MKEKIFSYLRDYKFWAVIGILALTFFLVYSPHLNYPYPLHVDEWHHISQARSLARADYDFKSVSSFEFGYHLFLAVLIKMKINLIIFYRFLPAVFSVFSSITLFFLVFKITKKYFISLFSIIFFSLLPSNVNLLGLWFAVPFTFCIPFVLLCFFFLYSYLEEKENKKYSSLFSVFIFILMITHAISAFFVFIVSFFYILSNYKRIDKRFSKFNFLIPFVVILFIAAIFIFLSKENILWFLSNLLFKENWTLLNLGIDTNPIIFNFLNYNIKFSNYFLPLLFGVIPFILSLFGIYFSLKSKKLNLFLIWFFYGAFMLFLFSNFRISPFVPHQRVLYYTLISLCVFAATGIYNLVLLIKDNFQKNKIFKFLLLILLFSLFLIPSFLSYGDQRPGSELYYLIQEKEYNDFLSLKRIINNELILAPLTYSTIIPAITDNKILADIYFIGGDNERDEINKFYLSDCSFKKDMLNRYNISFVYSKYPLNCTFLMNIHSQSFYLYSYNNRV